MGCGHNKLPGYVNVDAFAACDPDEVFDLNATPWPWPSDCAEEIVFNHSLEHMGGDTAVFLEIIKEIYRISAPGAVVVINVPHPRHDDFINDPTHVRIVTPQMLALFDRRRNDEWQALGAANSPLAHYTGVDFEITETLTVLTEPYRALLSSGGMTREEVGEALRSRLNVASEFRIKLVARK
jgi:hypothetical protein